MDIVSANFSGRRRRFPEGTLCPPPSRRLRRRVRFENGNSDESGVSFISEASCCEGLSRNRMVQARHREPP